jgi:hypothetical protein
MRVLSRMGASGRVWAGLRLVNADVVLVQGVQGQHQ